MENVYIIDTLSFRDAKLQPARLEVGNHIIFPKLNIPQKAYRKFTELL